MPYTPEELASFTPALRAHAHEVISLLGRYADTSSTAEAWECAVEIEHIARVFEMCHFVDERDAIVAAYNALNPFVSARCRHIRDAESAYSIPNYFAPDHPTARAYAVRVAAEKRDLAENFANVRTAAIAKAGFRLSSLCADAQLERLRTEPVDTNPASTRKLERSAMGRAA